MAPRITKVFPGGNTGLGFFSFYDELSDPSARRIYVIKGGPGVGKSTFMRRIADEVIKLGQDAEFLCCASDNDSYDGVRFPDLGIIMLDGTAPHVVDPKNPGAVDTIIHPLWYSTMHTRGAFGSGRIGWRCL